MRTSIRNSSGEKSSDYPLPPTRGGLYYAHQTTLESYVRMLCRKGWKAVFVVSVVVTGLLFRAEGALASDFSPEDSADSALTLTLNVPDFALINQITRPHYLGSNSLPDLLPNFPPQDLFSHRFGHRSDPSPEAGLDGLTWDMLWRHAHRIPVNAVPEPSALALFAVATLLLGARNLRSRK